jgi:hypothetical protein
MAEYRAADPVRLEIEQFVDCGVRGQELVHGTPEERQPGPDLHYQLVVMPATGRPWS